MSSLFEKIDVYLVPSFYGDNLLRTNLTGHPCIVLPNGFDNKGMPTSISFIGDLYKDGELVAVLDLTKGVPVGTRDIHRSFNKIIILSYFSF